MSQRKIAVLTDLDPSSSPGANLVALEYAKYAAKEFRVEFWSGRNKISKSPLKTQDAKLRFETYNYGKRFYAFPKKSLKKKTLREIFSFLPLLWIVHKTLVFRPNIVWVHQIGNVFPLSALLIFRVFKIPTVFTVHDFGILVPRKLYPEDLSVDKVDLMNLAFSFPLSKEMLRLKQNSLERLYLIRLCIIRLLVKLTTIISISEMQKRILEANNFLVTTTIENGVNPCGCKPDSASRLQAILFAGRLNGKGLNHAIELVKSSKNLMLHLAGSHELFTAALDKLPNERIVYHGMIPQSELFKLLHKVKFTSVMSDCFDVYPSLLLESMVHGSVPICYPTVGNAILARGISDSLVVEFGTTPDSSTLSELIENSNLSKRASDFGKKLKSFEEVYARYSSLFNGVHKEKLG